MSTPRQLVGEVVGNPEVERLEMENERLQGELQVANLRIAQLEKQNTRALSSLRQALGPLYTSLQQVFGQIDAAAPQSAGQSTPAGTEPAAAADTSKWDAIKRRNPGRIAEAIDVLLIHGDMNASQLAAALRMNRSNCSRNIVPKLSSMGLLVRNGHMFRLKDL